MANRLKMAEIQASTALLEQGWSQRRISRELGLDRETVARYAHRWQEATAKPANLRPGSEPAAEVQDPLLAGLPNTELMDPSGASAAGQQSACWPFREVIQ